jgi:ABC-type Zn uptake system ZnuABC Zn-binding protein ZnuA
MPRRAKNGTGHKPRFPATWIALAACAVALSLCVVTGVSGCGGEATPSSSEGGKTVVLADTSFLADIVQNVAGKRLIVSSLVPVGADPHSFEPTPQDAKRIAECRAVVITARGLIPTIEDLVSGAAGSGIAVLEASAGLVGVSDDPHYWLDPISVATSVDNIAAGLSQLDPEGSGVYKENAEAYKGVLQGLDTWIAAQVATIPSERRLLVTNHESFDYFARRYGFELVGAIFPTTSGEGSPSARQLADLMERIKTTRAPAIFLETGSNDDLARQVASETGVEIVTDLYTHSVGEDAPTYVDMMRWNVEMIVKALR